MEEMEINIDVSSLEEMLALQKNELDITSARIGNYLGSLSELLMDNIYRPDRTLKICKQAQKDLDGITKKYNFQYQKMHKSLELVIAILDANVAHLAKDKTEDQIYSDYQLRNKWQQQRRRSEQWKKCKTDVERYNQEFQQSIKMINAIGGNINQEDLGLQDDDDQLEN